MKAEEAKAENEQTEGEDVKAEEVEQPKAEEPKEEQQTEEPKEEEQLPTEDPKTEEQEPTEEASKQMEQGETSEQQGSPVGESNQGKEKVDNQGNPINDDGSLKVEQIESVDELTDEDFSNPSRNVQLPQLPQNIDSAIGANGKPVVIKKNIFGKNHRRHKDLTPEQSRKILLEALYNPNMYGQNQKTKRPYNWILIHNGNLHSAIIVEVDHNKDNIEIVNWHFLDDETLKQKEKQAIDEGGLILTLKSAVGNTKDDLSSDDKDTNNPNTTQVEERKKDFSTKKKKQKVNTAESLSKDSGLHIGKGNGKSVVNPNDFLPNKKEMKESSGVKRLGGVYYKNGIAYVSNGRRMVAIRCNYPEEYEGKTIKDGEIVEGEYPMIQDGIFPKDGILFNSPISVVEEVSRIPNNIESVVLNGIPYTHRDISEIAKVAGKTKNTITSWIKSKARGKSFQLELPQYTQLLIRRVMGKDYDSHNIAINGIKHGLNNHGANGRKLTKGSIPIREEDTALIPYIITAPDYVRKGSTDIDGRESIKFYKNLSNGYVVVVEKEYKNSPDDMETINIWAEMSDKAIDAQRNAAPGINVQNAILDIDVAKILKGVEYTIRCRNCNKEDHKIREQRTGQLVCGDLGLDYGIVWMLSMR